MSSKRVYKQADPPREPLHGGIYDVPGYPCGQCQHLSGCKDIHCDEFQRFWRTFMYRVREHLDIPQPELSDEYKLAAITAIQEDKP